jgi:hypothetical protein
VEINDKVYWFNGKGIEYTVVYYGIITAIEQDCYQVFSPNKPNFITINKKHVFSRSSINKILIKKRKQWAKEYLQQAKDAAQDMAETLVTIGGKTWKDLHNETEGK